MTCSISSTSIPPPLLETNVPIVAQTETAETTKAPLISEEEGEGDLAMTIPAADPTDASQVHAIQGCLYLTGVEGASQLWQLKTLRIAHIINISDTANIFDGRSDKLFDYTRILVDDVPQQADKLASHFDTVADLLHDYVDQRREPTLVHCTQGASRSVALILAYLIKYHAMTLEQALALVQSRRHCAQPNSGFMAALKAFAAASSSPLPSRSSTLSPSFSTTSSLDH